MHMQDTITLYHGTTHDITEIDVHRGKPFKDFGQGFYATAVYDHARSLALRNRRIEENRMAVAGENLHLTAFVYVYEFDLTETDKLHVKRFKTADREWLEFVILNRTRRGHRHDYDLVIGPTANDDTRASIRIVTSAASGAILSDAALDLLLTMLEPNNLPEQYYFGSETAAKSLVPKGRRVIQ
jgi:hypothetical protein